MSVRRRINQTAPALITPDNEDAGWSQVDARSASEKRADVAQYIGEMAAELARMATDARLETLEYLLTMARLEAEVESKRATPFHYG